MSYDDLEPVDRRATATIIAALIRDRIMDGTFESGRQLTEAQLADRLGVSRGPVREAFQRLVQEGLLEAQPHRGVFVATLDEGDAADVLVARTAIERAAAVRVALNRDPEVLDGLGALLDAMAAAAERSGWADVAAVDLQFHEALVAGAGSPRLSRMYATLLAETLLCLRTLPLEHPEARDVVAEHRALLGALGRGDADAAAAAVESHLRARSEASTA